MIGKIIKKILWSFNFDISKVETSFDISSLIEELTVFDTSFNIKKFGPKQGDGSYYIPLNILPKITEVISFGVGPNYEFEQELAQIPLKVKMYDASVDLKDPKFKINFIKKFVRPYNSKNSISINEVFKDSLKENHGSRFLLKMDIEGDEYANILELEEKYFQNIEIIVLELHYLNRIADKNLNREAFYALKKLLKNFRAVYHSVNEISSIYKIQNLNIPKYLEVTLVKK